MPVPHRASLAALVWLAAAGLSAAAPQPPLPSRPQTPSAQPGAPRVSDAQALARAAAAAARAEAEFLRAAGRAIAQGRRGDAEALARARGAGDPAAAAILARLDADRGRYAEATAAVQLAGAAHAQSEAALQYGLLLLAQGRRGEARRVLAPVAGSVRGAATPEALLRAGRAARALGQTRTAQAAFREAAAAAPGDAAINTAWGELFLDTHNPADATASFRAAIASDAAWAPAHAGLARALADEDPGAAGTAARRAVEIDPALVDAHLALAEAALDRDKPEDARAAIDRALAANPRHAGAHALAAAAAFVQDRRADFDAAVRAALETNPASGDVFRVAAGLAARHFRYEDAVTLVRRAVDTDPESAPARAALGLHLLRVGDEAGARKALEDAFKTDPYDLVTYNLLQMLDTLDRFVSIPTGDAIVRLHPDEAAVLRHDAVPLVTGALTQMADRWQFTPKGPILVEIFPKHDDFAVRTLGLPGLEGALGVCFGRVVTLDSPRARPPGTFNWQATLWHEMAHVFTMQLSNYRVPRWLTEGISVWEEGQASPEWARDSELTFLRAIADGRVLPLADLNTGFLRPDTIDLAYHQSFVVVSLIAERHGVAGLRSLVRAYADGIGTDEALRRATGESLSDLQTRFDAVLQALYAAGAAAIKAPQGVEVPRGATVDALRALAARHRDSYPVLLAVGNALAAAGARADAVAAFERAHALMPSATGAGSPRARIAELAERMGDYPRAVASLKALLADDHTNIEAARRTRPLARRVGDAEALALATRRIATLDPFDSSARADLGRAALARGDATTAVREFEAALAAGPVDPAPARCDLAEALLAAGDVAAARRAVLAALEIAPTYERAQDLLLRIVDRGGVSSSGGLASVAATRSTLAAPRASAPRQTAIPSAAR